MITKWLLNESIVSEEQTQETLPLVEGTIEDKVSEYVRLKADQSALNARLSYLKEKIEQHYDEHKEFEAQTIEVDQFTIQVVDRSRTSLLNRKELSKMYGQEWVKNHTVTKWHHQLSVKPKKRK